MSSIIMGIRGHLQMEVVSKAVEVVKHSLPILGKVTVPTKSYWGGYTGGTHTIDRVVGLDTQTIYTNASWCVVRNTDTGRFASMADWNSLDCEHNDEDMSDDQPWYFPGNEPCNPEDDMIASIDGDIEDNNELDAYVSYDMSLAELEEWVEFHELWVQTKKVDIVVEILTDTGLPSEMDTPYIEGWAMEDKVCNTPTDTVLPEDEKMMVELEKPIPTRDEKHGGPQTWDSKKEHRSFKLKETHKGHQPRGPVRVLASDYIAKIREAWLKKQQRRNNKKGN